MSKMYDVVALGELLIDFTSNGLSEQGNPLFEANPGGAPCNVLAMLKRFGHEVSFVGKVGDDLFGNKLKKALDDLGICTRGLVFDKEVRTTLAFVENLQDGDREFSFYRNPGADMMLKEQELDEDLLAMAKIFHFGTLSMTHEEVYMATKKAIHIAKEHGALISFDPNLRASLWNCLEEAKEKALFGLSQCDILKVSDDELKWLTGEEDIIAGVNWIRENYSIPLILVTMGKEGSRALYNNISVKIPAFLQENTIDTTGAGDTFFGCILHFVLTYGLENLTKTKLEEMLTFANGAASLITTKKGALRVMPTVSEIEQLISR